MVVIKQRKVIEVVYFEQIIKRCPVCLKDTEQKAYYAKNPDLSVTVTMDTTPQVTVKVSPGSSIGHSFEWCVLARCSLCGCTYRVMGVPRMRVKDLQDNTSGEEHELALTCCDLCYHEYYKYTVSDVFINLSSGGSVYLCKDHAQEVEQEKKREGDYTTLAAKLQRWDGKKEKPMVIKLKNGKQLILKSEKGEIPEIITYIAKAGTVSRRELLELVAKTTKTINYNYIDECISYLKGMNLVQEQQNKLLIKRSKILLTDEGSMAAEALQKIYKT